MQRNAQVCFARWTRRAAKGNPETANLNVRAAAIMTRISTQAGCSGCQDSNFSLPGAFDT